MVPTVLMVGESRLALIPEYLNLGSVVVVAPDQEALRRWQAEQSVTDQPGNEQDVEAVVDMSGRQILWQGDSLPLSQLEFKTLSALLAVPGRAISFSELRREAWGDGPEMPVDPYTVKALVQRLRAKLASVSAPLAIEAVRGFGFRVVRIQVGAPRASSFEPSTTFQDSAEGR